MEVKTRCDMACEILHATNDGDDLAPEHLSLVEYAVNGFLTDKGYQKFQELYEAVQKGYKKPWLQEVEPFTRDHKGYVYWNQYNVEHFDGDYAYTPAAKSYLEELNKRCELIQKMGLPVNTINVVWRYEKLTAVNKPAKD